MYLNIVKSINKINKKNIMSQNSIQFNAFYFKKFKLIILSFYNINISVLCLFDLVINNSIIKFFMIFLLLSFLNFLQKNGDLSNQSFFFSNLLYSKIYESFLILPLLRFFNFISMNIFNKHTILIDNHLEYKNFYLINLDENNTNILSFNNLHNILNIKKYRNKILWNELIYHAKNLKKYYLNSLGKISDKEYQKYFVKIEYKSTYPYMAFVIRFLPLLDGIALIHEYQPRFRNKKDYNINEFDIIYGTNYNVDIDIDSERFINEPKIIKERESFIFSFLLCTIPYLRFFYENKLSTYYSEEILNIFSKIVEKSDLDSSLNINYILSKILNYLYNEYLKYVIRESDKVKIISQENTISNKDKILKRNEKFINRINEDKYEIINNNQWNYSNFYHNQNLFKMTKIYYLLILFKPTVNISRYKRHNSYNFDDKNKYEYINIDLKKGLHKSINLTMKFSYARLRNNTRNNSSENLETKSCVKRSDSLNCILTKPISNYDGSNNFDSHQSTNNISSDLNKTQSNEDTFCSLKSIFELDDLFSIKKDFK